MIPFLFWRQRVETNLTQFKAGIMQTVWRQGSPSILWQSAVHNGFWRPTIKDHPVAGLAAALSKVLAGCAFICGECGIAGQIIRCTYHRAAVLMRNPWQELGCLIFLPDHQTTSWAPPWTRFSSARFRDSILPRYRPPAGQIKTVPVDGAAGRGLDSPIELIVGIRGGRSPADSG